MDSSSPGSSSGGERTAGPSKSSPLPTAVRLQRNKAEKQRRDRLNGYISELASLVPMVSTASRPLDKVSILRLAAAQMRLNASCLNPKRFKSTPVPLPSTVIPYLEVIEKTVGGFIVVTTFSGCIVFCSRCIEDYVGYQNIDVMGNSLYSYIHNGDVSYFEKKVNSVINCQKRGSRRTSRVVKVHMQQRPLPRSNDIRYRKMIFKISVHVNETGGDKSSAPTPGKVKKSSRLKDFGSSAVVLFFVEPARLEPEIDVSYIESHQDAYFTMHGLQGEIIYADQRISTITGYLPHDVQGKSAYQFICNSDVPIALFAQQAMFASNDGTGFIVYRLRIRDMRYIYLQSSGQIAFKDSSSEISHFVCFNKLLSDEEGSQELKKFQQRFAPQIMAAKLKERQQVDSRQPINQSPLSSPTLLQQFQVGVSSAVTQSSSSVPVARSPKGVLSGKRDMLKVHQSANNFPVSPASTHSSSNQTLQQTLGESKSPISSDAQGSILKRHLILPAKSISHTKCPPLNPSAQDSVNRTTNKSSVQADLWNMDLNAFLKQAIIPASGNAASQSNAVDVSAGCAAGFTLMESSNPAAAASSRFQEVFLNGSVNGGEVDLSSKFVFERPTLQKDAYQLVTNNMLGAKNKYHDLGSFSDSAPYFQVSDQTSVTHSGNVSLQTIPGVSPMSVSGQQSVLNGDSAPKSIFNDSSSFSGLLGSSIWSLDKMSGNESVNFSSCLEASTSKSSLTPSDIMDQCSTGDFPALLSLISKDSAVNHCSALSGFQSNLQPYDRQSKSSESLNPCHENSDACHLLISNSFRQSSYINDASIVLIPNPEELVNCVPDSMDWNNSETTQRESKSMELRFNNEMLSELEKYLQGLPQEPSCSNEADSELSGSGSSLLNNIS